MAQSIPLSSTSQDAVNGSESKSPLSAQTAMGSAALELKAIESQEMSSMAAYWQLLRLSDSEPTESVKVTPSKWSNGVNESLLGKIAGKERTLVKDEDFAPGGKYRSIVKLFLRYKDAPPDEWDIATGWLIDKDLVVTAGHCAYAWKEEGGGALAEVKAYIGYKGRKALSAPGVQFAKGRSVVTASQFIQSKGNRPWDAAFIKLEPAFEGTVPIEPMNTPVSGNSIIGVVGYPGDLKEDGEPGARMYEMFLPTKWDLKNSRWVMLEYLIDTFGGNSGSPVLTLVKGTLRSIGIHTYGGDPNSATVIGDYGIYFPDYLQAFILGGSEMKQGMNSSFPGKVRLVKIPPRNPIGSVNGVDSDLPLLKGSPKFGGVESFAQAESGSSQGEEFFNFGAILDTVTKVAKAIPPDILSTATGVMSCLGPVGTGVGMVTNLAVQGLASRAESTKAEAWSPENAMAGLPERAAMAQAALTAFGALMQSPNPEFQAVGLKVAKIAEGKAKALKPQYEKAAALAAPVIKDYTLRLALDEVNRLQDPKSYEKSLATVDLAPTVASRTESPSSTKAGDFAESFIAATAPRGEDTESWGLIRNAMKVAKPIVLKGAFYVAADQALRNAQERRRIARLEPFRAGGDLSELGASQAMMGEALLQALPEVDFREINDTGAILVMGRLAKKFLVKALQMQPTLAQQLRSVMDEVERQDRTESSTAASADVRDDQKSKTGSSKATKGLTEAEIKRNADALMAVIGDNNAKS